MKLKMINKEFGNIAGYKAPSAIVVWDFDGIISNEMYYKQDGKYIKHVQNCARHAMEMLEFFNIKQCVMSGDGSEHGQAINETVTNRMPVAYSAIANFEKIERLRALTEEYDIVYYVADDMFDMLVVGLANVRLITKASALPELVNVAYRTTTKDDYTAAEAAFIILEDLNIPYILFQLTASRFKPDLQRQKTIAATANAAAQIVSTLGSNPAVLDMSHSMPNTNTFASIFNEVIRTVYVKNNLPWLTRLQIYANDDHVKHYMESDSNSFYNKCILQYALVYSTKS